MLVAPIAAFGRTDVAAAGGKGANLGELTRAGFPVPDGFVVTTDAYRTSTSGIAATAEAIRAAAIPAQLAADIRGAYLHLGGGAVAVRSSATAEDLPGAAFAGQQESYLNLTDAEQVLEAVRNCWASLWSARAVSYRDRLGIDSASVAIAVVVQRLVPAEVAGVMFTAHPVTGDRTQVVIEWAPGLGESVVSGAVTPDHVVVSASGVVQERRCGTWEHVLVPAEGGGIQRTRPPAAATLSDRQLADLAALGRRIAGHFGTPQDIEWAVHDGAVSILQGRPMTALPPPVRTLSRTQRAFGGLLVEMLPRRPLPMELTGWILPALAPMVAQMYHDTVGVRIDLVAALRTEDGVLLEFVPPPVHPTWAIPARAAAFAGALVRPRAEGTHAVDWTRGMAYLGYRRRLDRLAQVDLSSLPWPQLLAVHPHLRAQTRLLAEVRVHEFPSVAAAVTRLGTILAVLGLGRHTSSLLTGAETSTIRANEQLGALAEQVRADPRLAGAFANRPDRELARYVRTDPQARWLRESLDGFLAEFGQRETTSILLPADPTWQQDPGMVLGMIRLLASAPAPAAADVRERALAEVGAHPLVRRLGLQPTIRRSSQAAAAGYAVREDTHVELSRLLPVVQALVGDVGRRLTEHRLIDAADDAWYLTWSQVAAIPDPATSTADLRTSVCRRRRRVAALAGSPVVNPLSLHPVRPRGDALCSGLPGGGGRTRGPVCVVSSVAEFGKLRTGDVLVCPATNPSWTPLFRRAAAVVVDHGGPASHAAIVAREYGLPSVMGTGNATRVLRDGQRVLVDGDVGIVLADA